MIAYEKWLLVRGGGTWRFDSIKYPLFTLSSIYSIDAGGAEQMPKTNNLNLT